MELMTKDQLISVIEKSNCKMLKGLSLEKMTKDEVVAYLKKSKCPVLKGLIEKPKNL